MWLFFALLSPLFWAIVHLLDRHCVERVFDRAWFGVMTGALASLVMIPIVAFAAPFVVMRLPTWQIIILALLAGSLIQLSQVFYFQSLSNSEAGIVAAYLNMIPALLPLASYWLFGTVLERWHYAGILILVTSSICFSLLDTNRQARRQTFLLMLLASVIQVAALMIEKYVFDQGTFFVGFLLVTTGLVVSGLMPLTIPNVRNAFIDNLTTLRPAIPTILVIEIANLIALFMSQRALDLGIPSLVAAVESSIPAYIFLLTIVLVPWARKYGIYYSLNRLGLKLIIVAIMVYGVWLVS